MKGFIIYKALTRSIPLHLLFILFIVVTSCGTAKRGEPVSGPLNLEDEQLQRGQLVFMNNCQKCHPGGEAGVGPSINNVPMTKGMLKFRVRSKAFLLGLGRMPSFKEHEISDEELDALVKYIKAVKKNKPLDKSTVSK